MQLYKAQKVSLIFLSKGRRAVGRESKAHPALCIILSIDAERYHPPPNQGYKYRFELNDGSLNKGNPRPSPPGRSNNVTVQKNVAPGTEARMYRGMILV